MRERGEEREGERERRREKGGGRRRGERALENIKSSCEECDIKLSLGGKMVKI